MTPLVLELEAFGPYLEKQKVDFSQFLREGLLLIRGETGAGKTALLDGISYALYGRSTGGLRGELLNMRCQLASEEVPTRVDFTFGLKGQRYRFARWIKTRRKRTGSLEYQQGQNCWQMEDGVWVPFFPNPKQKDLDAKAQELIGLDWSQFCQVMILPQGQFERLLTAKSEEKEAVLVTLFHAQRWQKAAEAICQQANLERQRLDGEAAALEGLLSSGGCASLGELEEALEQCGIQLEETKDRRQRLTQERSHLLARKEDETRLMERFTRLETLRNGLKELAQWKEGALQAHERIQKALWAKELLPFIQEEEHRGQRAQERLNELEQVKAHLAASQKEVQRAEVYLEGYRQDQQKQEERKRELAQVQALREKEKDRQQAEERLSFWREAWEKARKRSVELSHRIEQGNQRQEALEKALESMLKSAGEIPELTQRAALFQEAVTLSQQLEREENQLSLWREKLAQGKERMGLAQKRWEQSRKGAAASLAEGLEEGHPCPVCGSIHHPGLAVKVQKNGERLELQEVEQERREAMDQIAWAESQTAAVNQRIQDLSARKLELERMGFSKEGARQAEEALKTVKAQAAGLPSAQNETEQLRRKNLELQRQREAARLEEDKAFQQKAQAEALYQQIGEEGTSWEDLEQRELQLTRQVERFERELTSAVEKVQKAALERKRWETALEHLSQEVQRSRQDWTQAKETLEKKAVGLEASFQQVKSWALPSETLEGLQKKLGEWEAKQTLYQKEEQALSQELAGIPLPQPQVLEGRLKALEETLSRIDKEIGASQQRKEKLEEIHQELAQRGQLLAQHREENLKKLSFGRLLRGDNGVSLRRYVLGVMLSAITVEANRLLEKVHGGRYRLYRGEQGDRRGKTGLDLEVLDGNSGKRRSAASLSGGEKFLVSLALALGLAGVVQAQSGGVRMDAMFIDEGFGSLDPQSVEDALEVLASVSGSRRLVGIISHVAALQESITTSIQVVKEREGSHLVIHI